MSAADVWAEVDRILARPPVDNVPGQLAAFDRCELAATVDVDEPQQLGMFDPETIG